MIKNMTIRTKLFSGFGAVMLLAGIVSITAYISISTLRGDIREMGSKRLVQVSILGDLTKNIITATITSYIPKRGARLNELNKFLQTQVKMR